MIILNIQIVQYDDPCISVSLRQRVIWGNVTYHATVIFIIIENNEFPLNYGQCIWYFAGNVHNLVGGCSIVVFFWFKFHACLNELTTRKIMNRNLLNEEKFVCFVTKYCLLTIYCLNFNDLAASILKSKYMYCPCVFHCFNSHGTVIEAI